MNPAPAMIAVAIRSSAAASVTRNARSALGRRLPTTASTASAKAPREVLAAPVPQVTGDQLSLELDAGNKEQIASKPSPAQECGRQVEVRKVRPTCSVFIRSEASRTRVAAHDYGDDNANR